MPKKRLVDSGAQLHENHADYTQRNHQQHAWHGTEHNRGYQFLSAASEDLDISLSASGRTDCGFARCLRQRPAPHFQTQTAVENIKQDIKTLQTHLATLREKADALSGQISALQTILDSSGLSEPLYSLISSLLNHATGSLSAIKQSIRALEEILSDTNGLLGTADSILDDLDDINDVLNDYDGLPQTSLERGKDLTVLADQTLERVHQLIADIPSLSSSLDQMTETTNTAAISVRI